MRRCGVLIFCIVLAACAPSPSIVLQDLSGNQNLRRFTLEWVHGVRDGDRMPVQVLISDSRSIVTLDLHFAIGVPTTLESGTWSWSFPGASREGTVSARSVKFLGGQDGPPSIGGTFDLTGPGGYAYRVTIPLTVLPRSFRPSASSLQHH
jgi:hypothetical protein